MFGLSRVQTYMKHSVAYFWRIGMEPKICFWGVGERWGEHCHCSQGLCRTCPGPAGRCASEQSPDALTTMNSWERL
eukprot:1550111-Rhodomonas_salina.1